jgi:hypothetical protein
MLSIILGALLIVAGVVLAATRTASRGKLADPHATRPGKRTDTLEPRGRGARLSIKADLPGIAMIIIGALLLLNAFI